MERRKKERILHYYKGKESGSRPLKNHLGQPRLYAATCIAFEQRGRRARHAFSAAAPTPSRLPRGTARARAEVGEAHGRAAALAGRSSSQSAGLPPARCAAPGALPGQAIGRALLMRDVTSVLLHRASAVLRNTKTKLCTLISGDFQAEQLLCSEQDVARRQPGSHPIFSNAREKPEKPLPACRPTQDQQRASGGPARQGQTCARGRKTRPPLAVPPQPRRAPRADRSPAGHSCAPSRAPLVSHTYHAGLRQTRARRLRVTR